MNTLADVRKRAQVLLGDPDGDWADAAYLDPMINQVYETQIAYLNNTCTTSITAVKVILGIAIGKSDLSEYKLAGQPLAGLLDPLQIDWKLAGQPETYYQRVPQVAQLPDIVGPGTNYGMVYEWRAFVIYISQMSVSVDLRVRGEFYPLPLTGDNQQLFHPKLEAALAYGAAAMAGVERGNANYAATWGTMAENLLDDIAAQLIRAEQSVPIRLGKSPRRRRGFGSGRYW